MDAPTPADRQIQILPTSAATGDSMRMARARMALVAPPRSMPSAEEIRARAKWKRVRPSVRRRLRADFKLIVDQCLEIIASNDLFEGLFDDPDNIDLINHTAPEFFNAVQEMLYDRWILRVYKLGDTANAGRRETRRHNMSIRNLDRSLSRAGLRSAAIRAASKGILRYWHLIRLARNKVVAHADRRTFRSRRRLGQHEARDIKDFLASIQHYCDAVGRAVLNWPGELGSTASGDAGVVLSFLRDGLEAQQTHEARR